ncbi:MAG: riboflavin synthase [Chitinophagaceae bacterium]|nr:riboflavin synthase [Chitinophagaceae bacterium]
MFTGIIEATGTVLSVEENGTNRVFWIASPVSNELKPDQSVSHEGACLTVEEVKEGRHRVTAIKETLLKSTLGEWLAGRQINLERCLLLPARLDGHIVQGHTDTVATCLRAEDKGGSWEYDFEFEPGQNYESLIVEKGSVSLNGTSLTIFKVYRNRFTVAIIPYTYQNTSINQVQAGSKVNIEFDIIGKYILRYQQVLKFS